MKKALTITVLFFVFLIIFFLQSNFFNWYNIAGIQPNLFIIYSLFIGLFLGKKYGITFGIIFGSLLDFFIGKRIGFNGIMLGISGLVGGILNKGFSKESRIIFMLITFGVTILCEIANYTLQIIIINAQPEYSKFMQILIIEAIYNTILTIILYPLIQKTGNIIEYIFNEEKTSFMKFY